MDQKCGVLLEVTNVLQSHSPRSVPVVFHLPPLHPCLMYLLLLCRSPVQHAVAQHGSLLRARDVKDWQLSVDWGVSCAPFAWFFSSHNWSWGSTLTRCLPALVRVIIIIIVIPASFSASTRITASRPACATCAGTITATCVGTTTGCRLFTWFAPAGATCTTSGLPAYPGPVRQFQTLAVRGVFVP